MTEELQTTEEPEVIVQDEVTEGDDAGTGETGSELATDSGENHEEINQEKINQAINKQHAKYREEERKRKEAETRAQELEEKLKSIEADKPAPVVPPIPDPYDDEFEAKVKARDDALLAKAKYDAEQALKAEAEQRKQKEAEETKQAEIKKQIEGYNKRTSELGLKTEDVNKAGQVLVDYGINPELAMFILQDEDGPLITKHLAANPVELSEIIAMSPINAAVKINSVIRTKAASLKPKQTNAPDPTVKLRNQGNTTGKRGVPGTKYE